MAGLLIRELPDDLHRKLRMRAKQNRRSMSKEALILLEMAFTSVEPKRTPMPQPFKGKFLLTDEWIEQAKAEGRA